MMRSKVLFPQPEGPNRATNSPSWMRKLTSCRRHKAVPIGAIHLADMRQFDEGMGRRLHGLLQTIAFFGHAIETTPHQAIDGDHAPNHRQRCRQ